VYKKALLETESKRGSERSGSPRRNPIKRGFQAETPGLPADMKEIQERFYLIISLLQLCPE
jgi:hypothetical protein